MCWGRAASGGPCADDLPPRSPVYGSFELWTCEGTLKRLHRVLYVARREKAGRAAGPTAAVIDGQSLKSAERGARIDPSGYDAGERIRGKKHHVLVDTQGLLMHAVVHAADVQDRDGGVLVIATVFGLFLFLLKLDADGGYGGRFRRACTGSAATSRWRSSSAPTPPGVYAAAQTLGC